MSSYSFFFILWSSMLISTSGTFFLQVYFATHVFSDTGSGLMASLIFTTPWVLPVLLAPLVSRLASDYSPRATLISAELISVLVLVVFAIFDSRNIAVAFVVLCVRGFFEALGKTSRVVGLKIYLDPKNVKRLTGFYNTSLLLGNGLGGAAAALLSKDTSLTSAVSYTSCAIMLSAGISYLMPKPVEKEKSFRLRDTVRHTFDWSHWATGFLYVRASGLILHFLLICCLVGVFQSLHTVFRTALPMGQFGGDIKVVGQLQSAAAVGLFLGAILGSFFRGKDRHHWLSSGTLMITSVLATATLFTTSVFACYIVYLWFMLVFEVCWVTCYTNIIDKTPTKQIPQVAAFVNTLLYALLIVGSCFFGFLHDRAGLSVTAYLASSVGALMAVLVWSWSRPSPRAIAQ
jgi:predicted MFS family arabinose efflux permease